MPPVIFRFLNNLCLVQTIKQGKNASEALIETVTQMSTRGWNHRCFAFTCFTSHYFFSDYRTLNTSGSMDEIRQMPGHYRQQLTGNTSTFIRNCIKGIELLAGQPCSNIPANIRTDIRSTMKKAGYHPDEEGICYGVAWAALLACIRQDGQAYMQRMQYLA